MPLSATLEEIKAYQQALEKNKIKPDKLPPCAGCHLQSAFFKLHAYRERKFLVIVEMLIKPVMSALIRFKCPECGKTFTYYPDFALPYKRYTRPTITSFSQVYLEDEASSYRKALIVDGSEPGYQNENRMLAPTTIHRWNTTLSQLIKVAQKALDLIFEQNPAANIDLQLDRLRVASRKFKSQTRQQQLLNACRLLKIEAVFTTNFHVSIFTELASKYGFS
jgi:hypothetical protein